MLCNETWSCDHYQPYNQNETIFIDRIVPNKNSISVFWSGVSGKYKLYYRLRDSETDWICIAADRQNAVIRDLEENKDYEFFVECEFEKSMVGYARTGEVFGEVVNYLHPDDCKYAFSGRYLCTPSLLIHPDGYYLASMDLFEGVSAQNLTLIFRSDDKGETWYHYSELFPCFWGTLFMHKGDVYMLGTSTEYGDLLIGRSYDGGKHWGRPTVLARGSCHQVTPGWHKSGMPVVECNGRLWCGVDYGSHRSGGHMSCLVSADINSDLLDASSWNITRPLKYNPDWEGAVKGDSRGFIEGNAIVMPDGEICNILRYSTDRGEPKYGLAAFLKGNSDAPDASLTFHKFIKFPGNLSKFDIKRDESSGLYFSILSRINNAATPRMRNILSFAYSKDLENWEVICDLINCEDIDPRTVGFQYVSFCFDGEDIIYLCRTAFNGAKNFHDSNYITFHRIKNFRNMVNS